MSNNISTHCNLSVSIRSFEWFINTIFVEKIYSLKKLSKKSKDLNIISLLSNEFLSLFYVPSIWLIVSSTSPSIVSRISRISSFWRKMLFRSKLWWIWSWSSWRSWPFGWPWPFSVFFRRPAVKVKIDNHIHCILQSFASHNLIRLSNGHLDVTFKWVVSDVWKLYHIR